MKGTVYGGVICLPSHPDSDMHGLLRCIIRTSSWLRASQAIESIGVKRPVLQDGIWQPSRSAVELLVTEQHYAELLACPLASAYISAEKYQRIPRSFMQTRLPA